MATFAIDGVRIDPATGRTTHVRWARIDARTHDWLSPPQVVEIGDVVQALRAGEVCWTVFTLSGARFLGPKIRIVAHTNGPDGIDTDVPNGCIEKSMDDLPRV
ncbi:hypothetical protein [Paraburkholderia sp. DHOC27]|uniref:hypothetical protein n=1 Tax=Paraburkholderia sp. DHOC27 TaxID=2303330 RepID=UPI000E3B798C|nr:hypothetical protein [Paraburkholderia sp. DHOC27]RFU48161.1 hypothetical protein D0B32_11755 [Paraburkholderia sp. DHOC27]